MIAADERFRVVRLPENGIGTVILDYLAYEPKVDTSRLWYKLKTLQIDLGLSGFVDIETMLDDGSLWTSTWKCI